MVAIEILHHHQEYSQVAGNGLLGHVLHCKKHSNLGANMFLNRECGVQSLGSLPAYSNADDHRNIVRSLLVKLLMCIDAAY